MSAASSADAIVNRTAGAAYALAIETSGRIGSLALAQDDRLVDVRTFSTDLRHAVELMPTLDALCRQHGVAPEQVGEVYVSGGPGSFTGLRIGITVARTLAWAGGVQVVRVPTLEVIAQNALEYDPPPQHVAVILDAKRHNIYTAAFELCQAAYAPTTPAIEVEPSKFLASLPRGAAVLGEGIAYHRPVIESSGVRVLPEALYRARAEVVWRLGRIRAAAGQYDDPRELVPIYIRRPEAEEVWERRHPS